MSFFASGTSTPLSVYSGSDLTGGATTITLNSAGRPSQDIFLANVLYKMTLTDVLGNPIFTADPVYTSDYSATAKIQGYSGNPNGFVAGTASAGAVPADAVWDRTNHVLYLCTTTGVAAAAVWTVANVTALKTWTTAGRNVSPTAGVDFGYNTTLNALEYWNATQWLSLAQVTATTRQYLTSGTAATYTTPAGCRLIIVKMIGGGGGGGAAATNTGSTGGTTIFNSINANGGSGGVADGGIAGAGGTGGTGSANLRLAGAPGSIAPSTTLGGKGASGWNGAGGAPETVVNNAGAAAQANSGAGGAGGSAVTPKSGAGGGAGEYVEIVIASPAATYTYTIGAVGAGGIAGTKAGGNGGTGLIIVEEYY